MKTLEEDLLNSNQRHYINYKDPSGETDREMLFCVEDYLKYKKALEIIKVKKVQIATLLLSNACVGYNFARGLLGEELTQEDYELLKGLVNETKHT